MSRASDKAMDALHAAVAAVLASELKKAENPDFELSPQMLSQAIKFLKDNGVSAPTGSKVVEDLAAQLTDLDLDAEILSGMTPN